MLHRRSGRLDQRQPHLLQAWFDVDDLRRLKRLRALLRLRADLRGARRHAFDADLFAAAPRHFRARDCDDHLVVEIATNRNVQRSRLGCVLGEFDRRLRVARSFLGRGFRVGRGLLRLFRSLIELYFANN